MFVHIANTKRRGQENRTSEECSFRVLRKRKMKVPLAPKPRRAMLMMR
jgi:hypothetical protein